MVKTHRIAQDEEGTFKVPLLVDGVPAQIAGWDLELVIDQNPEATDDAAFRANVANGRVTVFDAVTWLVRVPANSLAPGIYAFAYRATSPAGAPQLLERGRFIVESPVS